MVSMEWQQISGNWVLIPPQPIAIIHFLGGAFVGATPNLTYRWLLEQLGRAGYVVIATPFVNTFDHQAIARRALSQFNHLLEKLRKQNILSQKYLPIYGLGHSMGSKLHLLIGSIYDIERAGNILISFNNYPLRRAIPFLEQLEIDKALSLEFTPSPEETEALILRDYAVSRNLLIKFSQDNIDQTLTLNPILLQRFPQMIATLTLAGNHLTPLGQEMTWQTGESFSPLDAIGQWMKQSLSKDLSCLYREMLRWLNPGDLTRR
jgi:hypothetical protein